MTRTLAELAAEAEACSRIIEQAHEYEAKLLEHYSDWGKVICHKVSGGLASFKAMFTVEVALALARGTRGQAMARRADVLDKIQALAGQEVTQ